MTRLAIGADCRDVLDTPHEGGIVPLAQLRVDLRIGVSLSRSLTAHQQIVVQPPTLLASSFSHGGRQPLKNSRRCWSGHFA